MQGLVAGLGLSKPQGLGGDGMAKGCDLGPEQVSLDPSLHVEPECGSSGEPSGPAPCRQSPVPPTQRGPRWDLAGSARGSRSATYSPAVAPRRPSPVPAPRGPPRAEPRLLPSPEKRARGARDRPPAPRRCPLPPPRLPERRALQLVRLTCPRALPPRRRGSEIPGLWAGPPPAGPPGTVGCGAARREREAEGGAEKHPRGWRGPPTAPRPPASLPGCGPAAALGWGPVWQLLLSS